MSETAPAQQAPQTAAPSAAPAAPPSSPTESQQQASQAPQQQPQGTGTEQTPQASSQAPAPPADPRAEYYAKLYGGNSQEPSVDPAVQRLEQIQQLLAQQQQQRPGQQATSPDDEFEQVLQSGDTRRFIEQLDKRLGSKAQETVEKLVEDRLRALIGDQKQIAQQINSAASLAVQQTAVLDRATSGPMSPFRNEIEQGARQLYSQFAGDGKIKAGEEITAWQTAVEHVKNSKLAALQQWRQYVDSTQQPQQQSPQQMQQSVVAAQPGAALQQIPAANVAAGPETFEDLQNRHFVSRQERLNRIKGRGF